jgi:hypothetical protein
MTDQEIWELFLPLAVDLEDLEFLRQEQPLLAHYTSLDVLEKIMVSGELWLSNPLNMNDLEEVRFGLFEGQKLFRESEAVNRACKTQERASILRAAFSHYYSEFDDQHAFDTYIFCLSQHDPKNADGLLSMWRGYGGSGKGAALIFNTGFAFRNQNSPILIARVHYDTAEGRISWMNKRINQWCDVLERADLPDDKLYLAAAVLFNLIKLFALKSKHRGFAEENEWRIIYLPERDRKTNLSSEIILLEDVALSLNCGLRLDQSTQNRHGHLPIFLNRLFLARVFHHGLRVAALSGCLKQLADPNSRGKSPYPAFRCGRLDVHRKAARVGRTTQALSVSRSRRYFCSRS